MVGELENLCKFNWICDREVTERGGFIIYEEFLELAVCLSFVFMEMDVYFLECASSYIIVCVIR